MQQEIDDLKKQLELSRAYANDLEKQLNSRANQTIRDQASELNEQRQKITDLEQRLPTETQLRLLDKFARGIQHSPIYQQIGGDLLREIIESERDKWLIPK